MKRILVVANHTLCEQHLLDELYHRRGDGPVQVHIVVPASHPLGTWSEGSVRADARGRLDDILDTLAVAGMVATGEISDASPYTAVGDVLRHRVVDEIVISTLPSGRSRWLAQGTVRRLARYGLPVAHVVADQVEAMA